MNEEGRLSLISYLKSLCDCEDCQKGRHELSKEIMKQIRINVELIGAEGKE
jgi:hypothetical protein